MNDYTHPAGEISANGFVIPIFVNNNGQWTATHQTKNFAFDTRAKLEAALKRETKKSITKVAIPIRRVQIKYSGEVTTRRGTLTGIHSGTGNPLVTWILKGSELKEQLTSWGESGVKYFPGDMPDAKIEEFARLSREATEAARALLLFEKNYKIEPKEALLKELGRAVSED
jgi:hypothetical protein